MSSNKFPNIKINAQKGLSNLGTPYYDSVQFVVPVKNEGAPLESPEYISSTVSIDRTYKVSRTLINGRTESEIKQYVGKGDYTINFNINLYSDNTESTENTELIRFNDTVTESIGQYLPDQKLKDLMVLINTFFNDSTIPYIEVRSKYLSLYGITRIIPTGISASQDHEVYNRYSIKITAVSDETELEPLNAIDSEIIPQENIIKP